MKGVVDFIKDGLLGVGVNSEIPNKIGDILEAHQTPSTEKQIQKLQFELVDFERQLMLARETSRRLNRRCQKADKMVAILDRKLKSSEKIREFLCKSIDKKVSQIGILASTLKELNLQSKKRDDSLGKWMLVAKALFAKKMYGLIITYPSENNVATIYVRNSKNVFEQATIPSRTPVECIMQNTDTNYVLATFVDIKNNKRFAWILSNNIQLYTKPENLISIKEKPIRVKMSKVKSTTTGLVPSEEKKN